MPIDDPDATPEDGDAATPEDDEAATPEDGDAAASADDAPTSAGDDADGTTKAGTFYVAEADADSAVLRDVADGQVHPLSSNPELDAGAVVEATLAAEPPMEVTWTAEVHERRGVELVRSDLEPTRQARETAAEHDVGDLVQLERAGEGEVHVLPLPPEEDVDAAATDVLDDEATVERAARLGAVRVEVRTGDELLSVRYLPD